MGTQKKKCREAKKILTDYMISELVHVKMLGKDVLGRDNIMLKVLAFSVRWQGVFLEVCCGKTGSQRL